MPSKILCETMNVLREFPNCADVSCIVQAVTSRPPQVRDSQPPTIEDIVLKLDAKCGELSKEAFANGHVAVCLLTPPAWHNRLYEHSELLDAFFVKLFSITSHSTPIWIMINKHNSVTINNAVVPWKKDAQIETFNQTEMLAFDNRNHVIIDDNDTPVIVPGGTGDLPYALVRSGLYNKYPWVQHIIVINVIDELALPDKEMLGHHILMHRECTAGVTSALKKDRAKLARIEGKLCFIEEAMIGSVVFEQLSYVSNDVYVFSVNYLSNVPLNALRFYKTKHNINDKTYVHYERYLSELTMNSRTSYVLN